MGKTFFFWGRILQSYICWSQISTSYSAGIIVVNHHVWFNNYFCFCFYSILYLRILYNIFEHIDTYRNSSNNYPFYSALPSYPILVFFPLPSLVGVTQLVLKRKVTNTLYFPLLLHPPVSLFPFPSSWRMPIASQLTAGICTPPSCSEAVWFSSLGVLVAQSSEVFLPWITGCKHSCSK